MKASSIGIEPARGIIAKLGGAVAVAEITGVHRTRVSSWWRPKDAGGTGGLIPQRYHRVLLDHASENGISLTSDEFLPLREAPSALSGAGAAA